MTLLEALRSRGIPVRMSAVDSREIRLCCPFCRERGQSEDTRFRLGVNVHTGWAHCFNCGWKSRKSLGYLSKRLDLGTWSLPATEQTPAKPVRAKLPSDYVGLWKVWSDRLHGYRTAREYFRCRGFGRHDAWTHQVGVSLVGKYSYRLIFPIVHKGRLRGFVGRDFTGSGKPPYLNSVGEKWLFHCPDIPENAGRKCVLVEGVFDCLALSRLFDGYDVMAVLGSHLSPNQQKQLRPYREVVLWPDADRAGITGFCGIAEQLVAAGGRVQMVPPVLSRDVDECTVGEITGAFNRRQVWYPGLSLRFRSMFAFQER